MSQTAQLERKTTFIATRRQMFGWALGGAALAATSSPARAFWQSTERFAGLRSYINDYVSSRRLPGALAAFAFGQGPVQTVAAGTLAMESDTKVDLNSLWRIYSMTKPITGMAVMQLIEQGRLALDQPLYDLLPRFRTMRVLTSADAPIDQTVPAERAITMRHLLTHTAGLGYSIVQRGPIKDYYEQHGIVPGQVSRLSIPGLDRGRPAPSLEAFADALADAPLVYQPGTRWSYSISLDLLGRVIEVVSGMPFDTYLKQQIFEPLGMTSTGFRVPQTNIPRLSTNYAPVGGILLPIDPASTSIYLDQPAFPFGGAGLVSSAHDYDRFLAMLMNEGTLDGERVLAPETARLAMSNLLPEGIDTRGTFADGAGFGAGGRVSLPSSPDGEGTFGWGGAAGTIALVNSRRRLRFAGYANYMPSEAYDFQRRVAEVFLADLRAMVGA
ncbi:beta-lactamase family protein [Sphingomonas lacunae]|uniref:Beta-lactamase family protein n=1 Tax=Sphingomonas lacunae TaxID=2698828 RepID=A0A6M4AXS8_9SPHN|nr:serine hydrolase domain-containing protein [Sphingomonas lacunae]QJQ31781.1 beta-lactamase family protein [Sphingomonas lacunae]